MSQKFLLTHHWYLVQQGHEISHNGVYKILKRADVIFRRRRDKKSNHHRKRKELNGKVERSFKTDRQVLYWKLPQNITFDAFQKELQQWAYAYNHHRPHSSLKMKSPAQKLQEFVLVSPMSQQKLSLALQRPRTSIADHFSEKLKNAGLHNLYFQSMSSTPKKKKLTFTDIMLELAKLLPPLCHICGDTTKIRKS